MGKELRTKRKKDHGEALLDLGITLLCFRARTPLPSLMPPDMFRHVQTCSAVLSGRQC